MATVVTFSKRDLGRLRKAIDRVEKPEIHDYLKEAADCFGVNACRAAVVLGWSAVVYYLRQTIELIGFDRFRRTAVELVRRGRLNLNAEALSQDNWTDGRLKDWDLLEICTVMGIITEVQKWRLRQFAQLRNDCAHPGEVAVNWTDAIALLEYVLSQISTIASDGWYLPAAFFEQFLTRSREDLNSLWISTLIELLREADYLPLVSKLLSLYNDPYQLIGPKESGKEEAATKVGLEGSSKEEPSEEVARKVGEAVPVLWKALASKLDDRKRIQANRKLAELLLQPPASKNVWWREFVFWDQWEETGSKPRLLLTGRLISEFEVLIDAAERNGPPMNTVDLDRIEKMAQYADVRIERECYDLLERARRVARVTE
jgi:hypothetical protein